MRADDFYEKYYTDFQSRGLQARYVNFSHKLLESKSNYNAKKILEIGGGIGEHVKFVRSSYDTYVLSDIRPLPSGITLPNKVQYIQANAEQLPFEDRSFDRIISTCVLHHLVNLKQALQEILRVWDNHGVITIQVPTDPHFMYVLSKKLFVNSKWKENGIQDPLAEHWEEHRNHFLGIDSSIKRVFSDYKLKRFFWPSMVTIPGLNLFVVYQISLET